MAINRKSLLENWVLSPLGGSTLSPEEEISDADITQALLTYYRYVPIKVPMTFSIRGQAREVIVPHADVIGQIPKKGPDDKSEYFYIGPMFNEFRTQMNFNTFDGYLLGPQNVSFPDYDPMALQVAAALVDYAQGDIYFEDDWNREECRFVLGGVNVLNVIFAVGQIDLDRVPIHHLELVSILASIPYYERLLAIRKTGTFKNTDFTISTEQLEATLERNRKAREDKLAEAGYMAITKG